MFKTVQTKPIQYEAVFYDGSLDGHHQAKEWVRRNGGELYEQKNEIRGTETIWLHSRLVGTVQLHQGSWIVKRAQDNLVAMTPEELNEEFDIL